MNRHAKVLTPAAASAMLPGKHALKQGELALLLRLKLIEVTGKTPDGKVTRYALTGSGRILAKGARS